MSGDGLTSTCRRQLCPLVGYRGFEEPVSMDMVFGNEVRAANSGRHVQMSWWLRGRLWVEGLGRIPICGICQHPF